MMPLIAKNYSLCSWSCDNGIFLTKDLSVTYKIVLLRAVYLEIGKFKLAGKNDLSSVKTSASNSEDRKHVDIRLVLVWHGK